MDPRMIPKGGSDEEFTDLEQRRNPNTAGVYYHPGADKFIETGGIRMPNGNISYDQQGGSIQGDAFAQIGYRKATAEEIERYKANQESQAKADKIRQSRTTTVMSTGSHK